jgi:C4-type Zn-finger protein
MSNLRVSNELSSSRVIQSIKCPLCGSTFAVEDFDSEGGFGPRESYQYFRHCKLCGWKEWEIDNDYVDSKEAARVISNNPDNYRLERAKNLVKSIDNLWEDDLDAISRSLPNGEINLEQLERLLVEMTFKNES